MKPITTILTLFIVASAAATAAFAQPTVHVEPLALKGPRALQDQTRAAVIRDYVESWKSFRAALDQNQAALLDADFVGTARDKLAETIEQQRAQGIHTQYQDRAHDLQIVFYSPEGLSVELTDKVDYDVRVFDHDKLVATQHVTARYVVVLSPSETRWRVRVFQAATE